MPKLFQPSDHFKWSDGSVELRNLPHFHFYKVFIEAAKLLRQAQHRKRSSVSM